MTIRFSNGTVRCADVAASAAFYRDVVGLEVTPLIGYDFPIEEVRAGGELFLHLIQVGEKLDELLGRRGEAVGGRASLLSNLEHLGLVSDSAQEADGLRSRLRAADVEFTERTIEHAGVVQFLFDDPSGIELEIGFPIG